MINAIVAVDKTQGIGYNNQLPWPRLTEDMKWFRTITKNSVVIMGSNTWKSLNCIPLPNRINIVLTRQNKCSGADHTFNDPGNAIAFCQSEYFDSEIFIIGGSAVYTSFKPFIYRYYITEIEESFNCDTFFDLDFVKKHFTKVKEHATVNEPIKYIIKEYNL
jgi:dihydrofolate reductase